MLTFQWGEGKSLEKPQCSGSWLATFPWWEPWREAEKARRLGPQYPYCFLRTSQVLGVPNQDQKCALVAPPLCRWRYQEGCSWAALSSPLQETTEWPPFQLPLQATALHSADQTSILLGKRQMLDSTFFCPYIHVHLLYGERDMSDMSILTNFFCDVNKRKIAYDSLFRQSSARHTHHRDLTPSFQSYPKVC